MKINRREFIKQTTLAGGALAITNCKFLPPKTENKLVILHTNDLHSRIEPFAKNDGKNAGKGGFLRLHTLIQQERKKK